MSLTLRDDDGTIEYRHCPSCGGALALKTVVASEPKRLVCGDCGLIFYIDPKVAVGAICHDGRGIVLLRRAIEPGRGKWVFPGGYVDRGETPESAARREALEEICSGIRIERLLNVYAYAGSPVIVIVYEAVLSGGAPSCGEEALEVRSFLLDEIPWDELAFPSTHDALREYLRGRGTS